MEGKPSPRPGLNKLAGAAISKPLDVEEGDLI
jgi:hypothetical protein